MKSRGGWPRPRVEAVVSAQSASASKLFSKVAGPETGKTWTRRGPKASLALEGSAAKLGHFGFKIVLHPAADHLAEIEDGVVRYEIIDVVANFSASHHVGVGEDGKMFGSVGLGGLGKLNQLRDRLFAGSQAFQQPKAHGVGQGFKAVSHHLKRFAAQWFGHIGPFARFAVAHLAVRIVTLHDG